jgi:alkylmercury lyase-like protein
LLDLRNRTYAAFVELGRAPAAGELGDVRTVREGWRSLHRAHALVLDPATDEIRMANPFSAVPTAYRVLANDRWWYANCAWDAFGILGALNVDGRVESSCPDCGEPYTIEVRDSAIDRSDLLFHCLVPAAHWWDDIVFT